VTFALSLSPNVLESLKELRGASEERIAEAARSASPPSAKTVSVHIVEVSGEDTLVRARSITPPHEAWGLGGGIVSTATPAAAAVRLLARGEIDKRGALPPERCIDPEAMFGELERRGVRFDFASAPAEPGEALASKVSR
jgi:saccharopine dehydrogenase-like NADP-dependent oxidoreductase